MPSTFYSQDQNEPDQFQCRHIFTDGRRCASPCLRAEELCYYHHTTRRPIAKAPARKARRGTFLLPSPADLMDRSGIQLAIAEVLQRIASNDIDPRRAGLLLYGLQTASINLPKAPAKAEPITLVDEIVEHPTLGTLAPTTRIESRSSSIAQLLDELRGKRPTPPDENADRPQPVMLPEIQACEATESRPNFNPLRTLHTKCRGGGHRRNPTSQPRRSRPAQAPPASESKHPRPSGRTLSSPCHSDESGR
jgi:hypothetical protein